MFCFYYAFCKDWKEAAFRCGVKRQLADRAGATWLRRKEIRDRIQEIQKEIRREDVRDFVVRILEKMAENDPGEWITQLINAEECSEELKEQLNFLNVTEFKRGKNEILELKFTDRIRILEKLLEISESGEDNGLKELCKSLLDPIETEEKHEGETIF